MSKNEYPFQDPNHTHLGGLLQLCFGVMILPIMDAFAKHLGADLAAGEIAWWRFTLMIIMILPMIAYCKVWKFQLRSCAHFMLPGLFIALGTTTFFHALNYMNMAKALTIFFISPFILTILSVIFMGEVLRLRRILCLLIGFSGALVVIRPTHLNFDLYTLYPIATALSYAIYLFLLRRNAHHNHPLMTQFLVGCGAVIFLSLLLIIGIFVPKILPLFVFEGPNIPHFPFLLGIGLVALIGHTLIASATRHLHASLMAPLGYMELLSTTAIGYVFFHEIPDISTISGATLIVGSGLYLIYREQHISRSRPPTPPTSR